MTRRAHLLGFSIFSAICLVLVGAPAPAAAAPAAEAGGGAEIIDLRLCGEDDYDVSDQQCSSEAGDELVRTGTLYCTASVQGSAGDEVTATLFHDGIEAYTQSVELDGSRAEPFSLWYTLGPDPLPGGEWECEVTGSSTDRVLVRSSGPRGDFLRGGACASSDAVEISDVVNVCPRSDQMKRFRDVESVTCSAILAGVQDREVRMEIEFEGEFEAGGAEADGWDRHESATAPLPIVATYLSFDGEAMTLEPDSELPPGPYTCRWLVDGDEVGHRSFRVVEGS
jgi:hypothetical protein